MTEALALAATPNSQDFSPPARFVYPLPGIFGSSTILVNQLCRIRTIRKSFPHQNLLQNHRRGLLAQPHLSSPPPPPPRLNRSHTQSITTVNPSPPSLMMSLITQCPRNLLYPDTYCTSLAAPHRKIRRSSRK